MNRTLLGLAIPMLAFVSCKSSDLIDPTQTFSGSIVEADTTLLVGESMTVTSQAEYAFGLGFPLAAVWGASDTAVLGLTGLAQGAVQVTARAAGTSLLVARINDDFLDTITVTVVDTGAVQWRRTLVSDALSSEVAIGDSGRIVAVDGNGGVLVFGTAGDTVWRENGGCQSAFGPAYGIDGAYVAGNGCAQRYSIDGTQVWSDARGSGETGLAVAADGSLVTLAFTGGVVTVSRYGITGALTWRDTLATGAEATTQTSGPAIATNGDIYVPWYTASDSSWLTRLTSAGAVRWTIRLPGRAHNTTPAVVGAQVFVSHRLGVTARDSAGQVVYDRPFTDIYPGGSAEHAASSPVIDASGNLYASSPDGMFSLSSSGAIRWVADSVQTGSATGMVPTPAILTGNAMAAFCGVAVCGIRPTDGVPTWHGPTLSASATIYGGLVSTPSGVLVVKVDNDVIALWHRRPMASSGWPTRGGNQGRLGRALQ